MRDASGIIPPDGRWSIVWCMRSSGYVCTMITAILGFFSCMSFTIKRI